MAEIRAVVRDPSSVKADLLPKDDRVKLLAGDATKADMLDEVF